MSAEPPLSKADLKDLERDLKDFIREQQLTSTRWWVGVQITYFFGTLAAVWFMLAHYKP